MYKNSILITGTIISLGYFIYNYINKYKGTDNIIGNDGERTNFTDNVDLDKKNIEDTITNVIENDPYNIEDDTDFSYISSYMELVNYIRDLHLIPNEFIYNLINNNNIYISLEDQNWYIKNEDDIFQDCDLPIEKEIKSSEKLTKKIDNFKTFKDNKHLLRLLKMQ
jgi:hypothetical protein